MIQKTGILSKEKSGGQKMHNAGLTKRFIERRARVHRVMPKSNRSFPAFLIPILWVNFGAPRIDQAVLGSIGRGFVPFIRVKPRIGILDSFGQKCRCLPKPPLAFHDVLVTIPE